MKGLILVNAYTHSEHELYQPRRLQEELAELGVATDLKRNDFCPAYLDSGIKTDTAEYDFCVSSIADLNRFYRQTVALYNADVAGYNYWRSLPLYRAFFHLFGFKTRPNIP